MFSIAFMVVVFVLGNPETQTVSHSFPKLCAALQKRWWIGVGVGVGGGGRVGGGKVRMANAKGRTWKSGGIAGGSFHIVIPG